MYSNKELSAAKKKFWTVYSQYMSRVPSAWGEQMNWINYKTGIKEISFKADVQIENCSVSAEIYSPDIMLQHHYFDLFCNFAKHDAGFSEGRWMYDKSNSIKNERSIIYAELQGVCILKEESWPDIITFMKKHLILLDRFWNEFKPEFE